MLVMLNQAFVIDNDCLSLITIASVDISRKAVVFTTGAGGVNGVTTGPSGRLLQLFLFTVGPITVLES